MGQGPAWFHYNFLMVMAGLLSLMAFNLRRRALLRLERLHLQDEQQKRLLEQAAAQAQQAREAAEAASRAKTTFLTMMSHDLRTPLTVILGYTEMLRLQAEMLGDAQMAHRLEQVEAAANNLLSMLNDLLDYARLDTEEILLTPEPVQAALVVTEVADAMAHKIEKYGNRLEVTLDGDLGEMRIDPQRLHQVLRNLLSYAARATTLGVVRLTGRREYDAQGGAWVVFEVSDDGPGLPSELAAGLFEPFPDKDLRQALRDAGGRRNEASMGLAISHRLCCRMGGELTVQSAPGAGTTFIARLPAA
jgi:signal transduction histidine kinase